mgnify:FL=1
MPIPHIRMIFCDCCGKLLKVEEFGDAMTPEEWQRFNSTPNKKLCIRCKIKKCLK